MALGGILGNGTKVAYSITSPHSWVPVTQLTEVTFPTWTSDKIDITTHNPTNKLKRYMPGLTDVGDPSFTVLSDFNPSTSANQAALRLANKSGVSYWWRFEVPVDRAKSQYWGIEFTAGVKDFSPSTPINGAQTTKFTLSFDGDDVYFDAAAGASEF